jgi:hypothetical protein
MWLDLLSILVIWLTGVFLGFSVYSIIINIKKTRWASRSNIMKVERQTPLTITKDIDDPSLEHPVNEADHAPESQTDAKTEDDDWLNNGVPKASVSTRKKEDDDWLNAETNPPSETVDESSLNSTTPNRSEIQAKQEDSNLRLNAPLQGKGEEPDNVEINREDSSPFNQS